MTLVIEVILKFKFHQFLYLFTQAFVSTSAQSAASHSPATQTSQSINEHIQKMRSLGNVKFVHALSLPTRICRVTLRFTWTAVRWGANIVIRRFHDAMTLSNIKNRISRTMWWRACRLRLFKRRHRSCSTTNNPSSRFNINSRR